MSRCCKKVYVILCCLEGRCSAVSGAGEDLAGALYLVGPSYFKKDAVKENLEKASQKKKELWKTGPIKNFGKIWLYLAYI